MPNKKQVKGGGSKLTRTQTVTVRLDPKLRYLAELAARKHRRTLSSFIEWAIEESLNKVMLYSDDDGNERTVASLAKDLWDVDEPDRFARLSLAFPELLTHDEQVLWKLIEEEPYMWEEKEKTGKKLTWIIHFPNLAIHRLRRNWGKFLAVARGEAELETIESANLDKGPNE